MADARPPGEGRVEKSAVLSECSVYRYRLSRWWGEGERMAWVMLNPSTADAEVDDPTIRRCMSFARREGYDGIEVINLFAYRATSPADLYDAATAGIDVVGPENRRHWETVLWNHGVGMIVAAWGANLVASLLASPLQEWHTGGWFCLGTTKIGAPKHPLYVPGIAPLHPWTAPSSTTQSDEPKGAVMETPQTEAELRRDVGVAVALYADTTIGEMAKAALDAIPNGWAKVGGKWLPPEQSDTAEASADPSSSDEQVEP